MTAHMRDGHQGLVTFLAPSSPGHEECVERAHEAMVSRLILQGAHDNWWLNFMVWVISFLSLRSDIQTSIFTVHTRYNKNIFCQPWVRFHSRFIPELDYVLSIKLEMSCRYIWRLIFVFRFRWLAPVSWEPFSGILSGVINLWYNRLVTIFKSKAQIWNTFGGFKFCSVTGNWITEKINNSGVKTREFFLKLNLNAHSHWKFDSHQIYFLLFHF